MPFSVEDFARTCLVRILPRSRYRLAAQSDARFQSFAGNTSRIAYRQQGATPSFLLFAGTGQNPHAAAMSAATWAEQNWRPNAIQRRVRPGVVVVHVAPGNQLTPAGPVQGAVVPAAVWAVDSATGKVETVGSPPGSPSSSEIKRAAQALMSGEPAPSLGELDLAEKGVMQLRTAQMPAALSGIAGILLLILAVRYGFGGLISLMALPEMLSGGFASLTGSRLIVVASFLASAVMLAGIVFGAALIFNYRNFAMRFPGFSSTVAARRNLAWGAYIVAMIGLAVVIDGVIPAAERQTVQASQQHYTQVAVSVNDDGGGTYVDVGGDVKVDLSAWPPSEWSGVQFKSSNPSVLVLTSAPRSGDAPIAHFTGRAAGAARVEASSADGKYTFQVSVQVGSPSTP